MSFGFSSTFGIPGTSPIASPPRTSRIGNGIRSVGARASIAATAARSERATMLCCTSRCMRASCRTAFGCAPSHEAASGQNPPGDQVLRPNCRASGLNARTKRLFAAVAWASDFAASTNPTLPGSGQRLPAGTV